MSPSEAPSEAQVVSRFAWALFVTTLLLAACWYTVNAFRIDFMVAGSRPGPGFFPRIVGIGLVVGCLYTLVANWRRLEPGRPEPHWSAILIFGLSGVLFVVGLTLLGTWAAIGLFLLGTLSVFNAGGHVVNIALSIAIPVALFLLFDRWLGVALPEGIIF